MSDLSEIRQQQQQQNMITVKTSLNYWRLNARGKMPHLKFQIATGDAPFIS